MMKYREILQSTLRDGSPDQITFYEEFMDLGQNFGENYLLLLRSYYRQKYEGKKFDLIVAQAAPALKFLVSYGEELFPGVPTIFGLVSKNRIEGLSLRDNVVGVVQESRFDRTVEAAIQLQPNVRKVVVLSGTSEADQRFLETARNEFRKFQGQLEFTYLTDLSLSALEKEVALLDPDAVVFYLTVYRDGAGETFAQTELIGRLAKVAKVPIYSHLDGFIEAGAIGGFVVSLDVDAREVGSIGKRVLAGEKPENVIARQTDLNRYMFDWRKLRQFGIDERRLPAGSIILFKQPTFWELYKWRVVAAVSLIILQALLIIGLLLNRTRRRKAEAETARFAAEVEAEHERLEKVVKNVPGIVWEARVDPVTNSLKTVFVSSYVEDMLGYTVDEWLTTPNFATKIMHQDDRETFLHERTAILDRSGEGVLGFRWIAKDGRLLWVEAHAAAIKDESGNTVGLRGVTMDITERKRDEQVRQQLTGRLLTLRDEEQRRIAAELHDGLGQSLAIIKNRAQIGMRDKANRDQIMEQLNEIAATATSSILEVRSIAHNLRPYELDRLGLVAAIESMIERISASTTINFSTYFDAIEGLLSPEAETSVYRIIQEGLNNVVKHSHADAAHVEIKNSLKEVTISVSDNGQGTVRPTQQTNGNKVGGFGLVGIAERVRQLGGSLFIDSQPGNGTKLTVRLELQNVVATEPTYYSS